jgi:hypothetical protein
MQLMATRNPVWRYAHQPLAALGLTALLLVLSACTSSFLLYLPGPFRIHCNGRIVDKLAVREETDQETFVRQALVVASAIVDLFNVYVGEKVYGEAKPGMWIKGDKFGVRVTAPHAMGKTEGKKTLP